MKKFYLVLFLLPFFLKSQVLRFPTSDVVWTQTDGREYYPTPYSSYTTNSFFKNILDPANTDTLIGGFVYKKIYYQSFSSAARSYFACFREDTLTNKVYMIEKDSSVSKLIYDFSPHIVGDTIKNIYQPNGNVNTYPVFYTNLKVSSIDSVMISSVWHKRYAMQLISTSPSCTGPYCISPGCTVRWLEGFGGMGGLFQGAELIPTLSMYSYTFSVQCITQNSTPVFPPASSCNALNVNDLQNSEISNLYPNPFYDRFTIEIYKNKALVEIYNAVGIKVYSNTIENKTEIDLSLYPEGVYFIKIGSVVKKIIKS